MMMGPGRMSASAMTMATLAEQSFRLCAEDGTRSYCIKGTFDMELTWSPIRCRRVRQEATRRASKA